MARVVKNAKDMGLPKRQKPAPAISVKVPKPHEWGDFINDTVLDD